MADVQNVGILNVQHHNFSCSLCQRWATYLLSRAAWIVHYRWRAAKSINFILKFYHYLTMRKSELSWLTIWYLLIMEFRFDAILYSNLGNKNYAAGHIKCSRWPHLARGLQVPHPCYLPLWWSPQHLNLLSRIKQSFWRVFEKPKQTLLC